MTPEERLAAERAELQRVRRAASGLRRDHLRAAAEAAARQQARDREVDDLRAERDRLAETAARGERAEAEAAALRERHAAAERRLAEAERALGRLRRDHDRLRDRRLVRLALAVAACFRPLFRIVRAAQGAGPAPPPIRVGPLALPTRPPPHQRDGLAERALLRLLRTSRPAPAPHPAGPRISAVVLNRDGEHHLRRLLPGLQRTAYDDLEVIVVDNASTDGSRAYLGRLRPRFPLTVIHNDHNASFAAGCNQGADAASGDLILLLNNDVEPVGDHWLARLVATMEAAGAAAVGARLVYPRRDLPPGEALHPDLSVQHRGIHLGHGTDGIPWPRNVGAGDDPLAHDAADTREVVAATAACLLVRRDAYEAVGGLSEEYFYGTEDVDFCLALQRRGERVVYDGAAVLWHHELATQRVSGESFRAENHRRNRAAFTARWGSPAYREVLADRLASRRFYSLDPLHAAVTVGDRGVDGDADPFGLAGLGWDATTVARRGGRWEGVALDRDVLVVGHPDIDLHTVAPHIVSVAVVGGVGELGAWLGRPWFDDLDIVVVPDSRTARLVRARSAKQPYVAPEGGDVAAAVRDAVGEWCQATRFVLLTAAETWTDRGDVLGSARVLQRHLERCGHPTRVGLRRHLAEPHVAQADVVVDLAGAGRYRPRACQVNVLWELVEPGAVPGGGADGYDLLLAGSEALAADLAGRVGAPVDVAAVGADAERFTPAAGGPRHEVLVVGDAAGRPAIVDDLLPAPFDLAVYGRGWFPEIVDPAAVRGDGLPDGRRAAAYAAAGVVLHHHLPHERRHGVVGRRLYEALAAGAFVVSEEMDGLADRFDGGVVTYHGRDDLLGKLSRYLADPDARREVAARGRRAVLSRHTAAHRVADLLDRLAPLLAARPRRVAAPAPRRAVV